MAHFCQGFGQGSGYICQPPGLGKGDRFWRGKQDFHLFLLMGPVLSKI